MRRIILLIMIIVNIVTGCVNDIEVELKKIIGKEIVFPEDLLYLHNMSFLRFENDRAIVIYVDSSECVECRLSKILTLWNLIKPTLSENKVDLILIFNSEDIDNISQIVGKYSYNLPYYLDMTGSFKKYNYIPKTPLLHTFMISKKKIILAGDILDNPKMQKLYIEQILSN